jgi:ABC-type ATPase with predicted acetyltransferase domain
MKFIHERPSLFLTQVFETSLENTTAIRMGRKFENAALESWNETQTLSGYTLDEFLHDLALGSER